MTNRLAYIDTEDYDDYNRKKSRRRRKQRLKRRRPPMRFNNSGFPIKIKIPTKKYPKIVKGRPTKLPPLTNFRKSKNTGVMKPNMMVKKPTTKKRKKPIPIKKIGIDTLIKKTAVQKKTQTKIPDAKNQITSVAQQNKVVKKAVESDTKIGKTVKILSGIAIVGLASFGIYKYIQHRKKLKVELKKSA